MYICIIEFEQSKKRQKKETRPRKQPGFLLSHMPDFMLNEISTSGNTTTYRSYTYRTTNLLLEPQMQVTLGGENVKWVTRVGFSWMSDLDDGKSESDTFINDWFTVGTGIQLTF